MVTYTLNKALPPIGHFDVLVVGGGPAGIGASIGAARRGASVGLIERSGQLGGMMTLGSVAIFMPVGSVNGIYAELIDVACKGYYLNKNPYLPHSQFNPIHMRYECMRKVVRAGVTVYLHSEFLSVLKDGSGKPSGVAVHTREGLGAVTCGLLIDCTGDARAAIDALQPGAWTGLPYTARVLAENLVRRADPAQLDAYLRQLIERRRELDL
ncbi:MAG: FAD-dependent oxidoreductase, partial [Oscillospiraceae bacterium]|nr:FAD-dependent oxidoreductase [Oscillospiraceae bacterium]